jgi:hypothetical protein
MVPQVLTLTPGDINVTDSGVVLDRSIEVGTAMITVSPKTRGPHSIAKLAADALSERHKPAERRH